MRRALILILAAALFLCGCASPSPSAVEPEELHQLATVQKSVKSMKGVISDVQELIDWQVESSSENIENAKAALAAGEIYVAQGTEEDEQEIRDMYDRLAGLLKEVKEAADEVEELQPLGVEQVDMTTAAAREYFRRIAAAIEDIQAIFDFFFAQIEGLAPIDEFDTDLYGNDDLTRIYDLWLAVGATCDNLRAIDCPDYMAQTFGRQVDALEQYRAILESLYYGVENQDVLRSYSASYMINRIDILVTKYDIQLSEDFNMQFIQAGDRLSGSIGKLGEEILTNCEKLLEADWR